MNDEPVINKEEQTRRDLSLQSSKVGSPVFISMVVIVLVLAAGAAMMGYTSQLWQYFVIAGSFGLAGLFGLFSVFGISNSHNQSSRFIFVVLIELALVISAALLTSSVSLGIALIALVISLLIGSTALKGSLIEFSIFIGLVGAVASALLGNLQLVAQVSNPALPVGIYIGVLLLGSAFLVLLVLGQITASLRVKLLLGGLLITLLPLAVLSVISNQFTQSQIQAQSNQSLSVAANQTANAVDDFFSSNLDAIKTETTLPAIQRYLTLREIDRPGSVEETELKTTFVSLQTQQKIYQPSFALLDVAGKDLFDTDTSLVSSSESDMNYFRQVQLTGLAYSSGVIFPAISRDAYLVFISPIKNVTNQTIGYLRVRYDALVLQSIIQSNVGLTGARSFPMLVDENGVRLADAFSPNLIYRTLVPLSPDLYQSLLAAQKLPSFLPVEQSATNQTDLAAALIQSGSSDFFNVTISGPDGAHTDSATTATLKTHPWKLIYLQEQTALVNARDSQNKLSTIIATIIAGLVGLVLILVSGLFSQPILQLTRSAEKISAGDLSSEAKINTKDEIGILGNAFNSMTHQLKQMVDTLESRVQERTDQLARQNSTLSYRSSQLRTVADVARNIVSIRDLETLLTSVTNLISERFDFYHVGIFLVDNKKEYAVLRAANSAGGQQMLARQHKLRVGQTGIVGYATQSGEPRIATDVGKDAAFFNNPDLPETRSEMALPLKVEGEVIGALDVQSTEPNAFSEEDIELFATLADQIAVAIKNNQLFEESRMALEEAQGLHQHYLNQEWSRRNAETRNVTYKFTPEALEVLNEDVPEIETVLATSRPLFRSTVKPDDPSIKQSVLAVPINLRGETIGVIHLQEDRSEEFEWSENEVATVQAVSDQVAQTLENARLFETTIRRAERERKVLEITSRIRSTNDPQQMLKVTLEELKKNLGITDGQVIVNLPGGEQDEVPTRFSNASTHPNGHRTTSS